MISPSAGRRLGVAVLCGIAVAACAAPANAQEPIHGFTAPSAEHQRAYESRSGTACVPT